MPCRMYVSHLYAQRGLALLVHQADQSTPSRRASLAAETKSLSPDMSTI